MPEPGFEPGTPRTAVEHLPAAQWYGFIQILAKNRRSGPIVLKIGMHNFFYIIKKKTKYGPNWSSGFRVIDGGLKLPTDRQTDIPTPKNHFFGFLRAQNV